jgi:putative nucleotidyltransferase with HDIG domain
MNTTPGPMKTNSGLHNNAEISIEHKEYETKLDLLYDIAQQASSVSEVSDLLKEIPFIIQKILRATASTLFLVDEEKWQFRMRVVGDKKQKLLEEITYSLDYGIAGWVARNNKPLVIDDVTQDERFHDNIDAISGITPRSLMAAPLGRGSKVIGVLEILNKVDGSQFQKEDLGLLMEFANTEALNLLVSMATTLLNNFKLCQSLQNQYKNTVETLVTFADAKDPYSYGHSRRVKEYSLVTAEQLKLPPEEMRLIEFGALLHDIGKLGIDDRILRKPESLTTEEWYIIRKHTIKGANIVRLIPSLQNTADLILYHHEHHDGKGYPEGLKGDQIPVGSQIIAVADAFETMTTDRAYRTAMTIEQAIAELKKNSGTQFSPKVVEAFLAALDKHKGLLENLERHQKPAATPQQHVAPGETAPKQPEENAQPVAEKAPLQETVEIKAAPETEENKPAPGEGIQIPVDEGIEIPLEIAGTQPLAEENKVQQPVEPEVEPEHTETEPEDTAVLQSLAEDIVLQSEIEKNRIQEAEETEVLPGKLEIEPETEAKSAEPEGYSGPRPETESQPIHESGLPEAESEDQENMHEISEILKILTENSVEPPITGSAHKHEARETGAMPGHTEIPPHKDEPTKDSVDNAEKESVVIDVTKQKKKSAPDTSDLVRNKENQLDAAEMLKKLLGDVRTRKDTQEKKPAPPVTEKPASQAPKETHVPPKSTEATVPPKSQEAPVKAQHTPSPSKSQEVPAQHKHTPTPPASKNQDVPPQSKQEVTAQHKPEQIIPVSKNQDIPPQSRKEATAQPKPEQIPPASKNQDVPPQSRPEATAQPKSQETPAPVKAMEALIPGIAQESGEEQPPSADTTDDNDKKSGKQKSDRKKAEKEAKLASKRAEQEAKREKQEAKKAKKARTVSKTVIDISSELFEGEVKLEITPFINFKQTDRIKKYLLGIDNVKVISQGWSEEEGYIFFLSITEPTVLGPIFQQIPGVEKVYGDGKRIIAEGKPEENANPEEPEDTRL